MYTQVLTDQSSNARFSNMLCDKLLNIVTWSEWEGGGARWGGGTRAYSCIYYTAIYCNICVLCCNMCTIYCNICVLCCNMCTTYCNICVLYTAIYVYYILQYIIQWNLSIEGTLNKGHLSNEYRVCCPNHIELCTNHLWIRATSLYRTVPPPSMVSSIEKLHCIYKGSNAWPTSTPREKVWRNAKPKQLWEHSSEEDENKQWTGISCHHMPFSRCSHTWLWGWTY